MKEKFQKGIAGLILGVFVLVSLGSLASFSILKLINFKVSERIERYQAGIKKPSEAPRSFVKKGMRLHKLNAKNRGFKKTFDVNLEIDAKANMAGIFKGLLGKKDGQEINSEEVELGSHGVFKGSLEWLELKEIGNKRFVRLNWKAKKTELKSINFMGSENISGGLETELEKGALLVFENQKGHFNLKFDFKPSKFVSDFWTNLVSIMHVPKKKVFEKGDAWEMTLLDSMGELIWSFRHDGYKQGLPLIKKEPKKLLKVSVVNPYPGMKMEGKAKFEGGFNIVFNPELSMPRAVVGKSIARLDSKELKLTSEISLKINSHPGVLLLTPKQEALIANLFNKSKYSPAEAVTERSKKEKEAAYLARVPKEEVEKDFKALEAELRNIKKKLNAEQRLIVFEKLKKRMDQIPELTTEKFRKWVYKKDEFGAEAINLMIDSLGDSNTTFSQNTLAKIIRSSDFHPGHRYQALHSLGLGKDLSEENVGIIEDVYKGRIKTDPETQDEAGLLLGVQAKNSGEKLPQTREKILRDLMNRLGSAQNPQEKIYCLNALGNAAPKEFFKEISQLTLDPEMEIRAAAVDALRFIKLAAAGAVILTSLAKDKDEFVRRSAAGTLGYATLPKNGIFMAKKSLVNEVSVFVKLKAISSLFLKGELARPIYESLARSKNQQVKEAAKEALKQI